MELLRFSGGDHIRTRCGISRATTKPEWYLDVVSADGYYRFMLSTSATAEPPEPSLIVRVVGQHTKLRSVGGDRLRGVCPFCGSTAFRVRPRQGTFYCFGCGAGGDAHMFASQIERDQ